MCIWMFGCLYTTYVPGTNRGQKRALVHESLCGDQREIFSGLFSPSTLGISEIKLRL